MLTITSKFKGEKEMRKNILVVMTGILVLALATIAIAAEDPFVGTWKLNAEKTKFPPGQEMKSYVIKWEKNGSGYRNVIDMTGATNVAFHVEFAGQEEGVDYPITGNPIANTISFKKIDTNTVEATLKRTGTAVARLQSSISADGKTLTILQTIIGASGIETASTIILDKQ